MKHLFFSLFLSSLSLFANGKIYVANQDSDNLSVIDPATNTPVATITVGEFPQAIGITPDQQRAYVTNSLANTVSVVDLPTNTTIATIAVDTFPFGAAVTPMGDQAYITNQTAGTVNVIDVASNTIIATIPVGSTPQDIAVSPDGKSVYATGDPISVIDVATNSVIDTISLGSPAEGIAIAPGGKTVYASYQPGTTGLIAVIDSATNTVTDNVTLETGLTGIGVSTTPNGKKLYVSGEDLMTGDGLVSVILTANNTIIATVPVNPVPTEFAFSTDGTLAYVTSLVDNLVNVIDVATDTLSTSFPVGMDPAGIATCPAINRVEANGKKDIFLTQTELFNFLSWTPLPTALSTTEFRVYRNEQLLATLPLTQTEFSDHNREKNTTYTYRITQVINNVEADVGSAVVRVGD
ncbi:MAG: hypothetical protein P0S96_02320 [Simkaniaceae bacterium]|nr:hypothetical protein [Candidatus Sacchlamyda saccharinae]